MDGKQSFMCGIQTRLRFSFIAAPVELIDTNKADTKDERETSLSVYRLLFLANRFAVGEQDL